MDVPEARCFRARLSTLPDMLDYLRQASPRTGVEPVAVLRIELVLGTRDRCTLALYARELKAAMTYRRASDRNVLTLTFRTGPHEQ